MSDPQKLSRARWAIRDILQFLQSDRPVQRSRVEKAAQGLREASFAESAALLEAEFRPVFCGRKRTPELLLFVQSLFDSVDAAISQRMKQEICSEGAGKPTTPEQPTDPPGSTTEAKQDEEGADDSEKPPVVQPAVVGRGMGWQHARDEADKLRLAGERFTSYKKMADAIGCTKTVLHDAIKKHGTPELEEWASKQRGESRLNVSPEVAAVVFESTPQGRETDPANVLHDCDVDVVLAKLLGQASPEERARINGMPPAQKRQLAETFDRDRDTEEQDRRHAKVKRKRSRAD